MACSSNSIIQIQSSVALMTLNSKYDVFVSFRGTDTRYNFTDNLFAALQRKGICAFRDDTKLKKGESIAPELLSAIQGSQIFIVVFSKNYAASTWCLRELEYILECVQVSGKRVLPVFYDVDPSEVRKQSGSYAEAFAEHEERFKKDSEMMQRWRASLTHVGNLAGWDVRDKPQSAQIEMIVEEIIHILGHKFLSLPNDLVGMHSPLEKLERLLLLDSVNDVRVVGICGMGGVGKTTLATVLYGKISHQFDLCCFIDDLSKIYREDGLIGVQKQVLHQTLGKEHLQICNIHDGANLIQSRLGHARALIILDNVDQGEQLERLGVNRKWLAAGSRIIIVSRDAHILNKYGVDVVYKVPLLNDTNSLQLFCQQALNCDNLRSNYEELASEMLNYANGLPLAIKALGSFLFGRDISEWRSALARLRKNPIKDIMDVLRLSFDGLEEIEKEIFLDIACFFNGYPEKNVKDIHDCCGFHPEIGLRVLIDKSLISISDKGRIEMLGLLEDLGKIIVQENSSKEPRKWSRLWLPECFYNVMTENMENKVEAIVLWFVHEKEMKTLMAEALSKMSHLRLLILKGVHFCGSLHSLSNELRYIDWCGYPFMYLPPRFQPNQLVRLFLVESKIKQLWEGKKYLPSLKVLDLRRSRNLKKMPDFREFPNLEWLILQDCVSLEQIDPSIGVLKKLLHLDLGGCTSLANIPNDAAFASLTHLSLSRCYYAFNTPLHKDEESSIFKRITSRIHSKNHPPPDIKDMGITPSCSSSPLPIFSCLRKLDISYCGVSHMTDAIGSLRWLEILDLTANKFVTLSSFRELSRLTFFKLDHCKQLRSLPELPVAYTLEHSSAVRTPTMSIFNCPELDESGECMSMTFSWMIQLIRTNQEKPFFLDIDIVIPGNEIPRWFNNQSAGCSISMKPSPIMHDIDHHIIGVAFCAVFSAVSNDIRGRYAAGKRVLQICFRCGDLKFFSAIPTEAYSVEVKSSYIWLTYLTRETFFDILRVLGNTNGNLVEMEVIGLDLYMDVVINKCGYSWVSKQDIQPDQKKEQDAAQKFLGWKQKLFGN